MSIEKYREKYFTGQSSASKMKSGEDESKVTKRELLKNLATGKLETLTRVFNLESKLPMWPEREDYIKILSSSRKVTVDNIKSTLRI
ncbi:hypothetical protein RSJ42_02065 [Methanosarcina hadiensis]|uniref:hypothetical protein n=1 Tax=Methanosarcina hadiensis TaxID=3078083 RepID=UPI00397757DB